MVLYVGMPRKLRIAYPGAMYHVMSRGDRREKIFLDNVDRQDFIKTLAEACQKTNWQVHTYCLMPNHTTGCWKPRNRTWRRRWLREDGGHAWGPSLR
ncbi:MAG: transposase [Verrucomicrobiota bacterium]